MDTKKSLEDKKRNQQEAFRNGLIEKKENYQSELARTLQRVYNRPLMFETSYNNAEKAHKNRGIHQKMYGENNYENNNSNYNYSNTDVNQNESEMRQSELNNTNKITNLKEEDEEYEGLGMFDY